MDVHRKISFKGPNHKLLVYEYCDKHYCSECVEITDKEYKIMTDKPQIHWFCPPCDTKVMKNLKNEKSCKERCQKFLKKVEERIIELEKEIRTKVDETRVSEMIKEAKLEKNPSKVISPNEVKEVVQIQVKEQNMESKDREKRLNKVIIFNLPESIPQLKTTRQQHDKEKKLEMCTEINNNFTDTDVTETRRLGEAKENATGPRPVLITLTHIDKKRTLLQRFHHIRDNDKFKNIKLDHDKTKQEREESKKLYEEAKRQEAAYKSGGKPVKTTNPPRMTDGKTNVNKNNLNDIGHILCFHTNADQLRNKQN